MKKPSFTLAETLIVMGVIGVVAALTLPNLNSSTNDKEKVAKLQKVYSNLQDAFGRAEAVYGPYDEWFVNDGNDNNKRTKRAFERITEFMKYSKVCTVSDNCELKFSTGASSGGETRDYSIILADGSTLGFSEWGQCIYIDIDGINKGSNKPGRDVFQVGIRPDNNNGQYILTYGFRDHIKENYYCCERNYGSGEYTAWVLVNGNMDYLKTSDGKTCPDGQKLQFGVKTTCK